jgi:spermidine synthase
MYNLNILIIGLSGLVAQVLVMRELWVTFYGFELLTGAILSDWLILEAAGVYLSGIFFDRIKNKLAAFIILQALFVLGFPISVYMARTCRNLLNIPFGQAVNLPEALILSFMVLIPVALTHGALFSAAATLRKDGSGAISRVYALETIGTVAGGLCFTYMLLPYLNSFKIVFAIGLLNLTAVYLLIRRKAKLITRYILIFLIGLLIIASFSHERFNRSSIEKQFQGNRIVDYRNSVYGNISVVKLLSQYTFYYNARPLIISPYPDRIFVEEFANIPMLFANSPADILIIGNGMGGIINELLNYKESSITYAELDPELIKSVRRFPTYLTDGELNDPRVRVVNIDARRFLVNSVERFDCVLIGLSGPQDLSSNRFYTKEFFAVVNKHLRPQGIFAFSLPGSSIHISRELANLNQSILNSLSLNFKHVRVIAGDYNIYLASDAELAGINAEELYRRAEGRGVRPKLFIPGYLNYRIDPGRETWFKKSISRSKIGANLDLKPSAVLATFELTNKEYFPQARTVAIYLGLALIGLAVLFLRKYKKLKSTIIFILGTTGFFSMLMSLLLIACFQVFFGYMYYWLGIFISVLMAGIAVGSWLVKPVIKTWNQPVRLMFTSEIFIVIFTIITALGISSAVLVPFLGWIIFGVLFFLTGVLTGAEFTLATLIWPEGLGRAGSVAGALYAADLGGGWFAGIVGSFLLLPVLGIKLTCLLIAFIKIGSLILARMNLLTKRAN